MNTSKILSIIVLSLCTMSFRRIPGPSCPDLEVTLEITHTSDNQNNGKVEVSAAGGERPYMYVFYYTSGHPVRREVKDNKLENLKAGKLYCSVVDAKGCTKKIEINIE